MLNYLKFLRVGRPPKYILSSAFKSRPKLFPEDEVAMFSSSLVSISTIDMLAVKEIRNLTFNLRSINNSNIVADTSR